MPYVYTTQFRVRHYECDAYGHMSYANYARYMQETAIAASNNIGYDKARYDALNMRWLIYETHIEYLQPLFHEDEVQVKTWVGGFRRVRSERNYEFFKGDVLAARARTDWVLLDLQTRQPIAPPPAMVEAYGAEGAYQPPQRFAAPPTPPPAVFRQQRRVMWSDLDSEGHVNNARYLEYVSDIAFEVSDSYGWTVERMRQEGFAIIARAQHIEYKQPAMLGDTLDISTYVYDMKRISATRYCHIARNGETLAHVRLMIVAVHPATGKPTRIPAAFLEDCASNIAHD